MEKRKTTRELCVHVDQVTKYTELFTCTYYKEFIHSITNHPQTHENESTKEKELRLFIPKTSEKLTAEMLKLLIPA
jgi:hypothetical protein